ncbi:DUF4435 domain-containing protein [Comamonas sp.]|uniref:DUF4435 domain-containing protein n=1 Tax=Comamonas sp. TaxID=34028 RepID=UPI00289E96BB|nr:DUF4435 domain-containing protein [Comamonas sp.]
MSRIPGIEISELCAKYEYHPSLIDFYVEGEFDRDLLNYFFGDQGHSSQVSVIAIDQVEITDEILVSKGLPTGSNKSRLIALALEFNQRLSNQSKKNVSCIVDTDHDEFLRVKVQAKHLFYTDYTCMEMYCLNDQTLKKFLLFACNLHDKHFNEFNKLANIVLPVLFCIRIINQVLSLNSIFPSIKKGLKNKRDLLSFDANVYIDAFIQTNNLHSQKALIKREYAAHFANMPLDIRFKSNGHDFVHCVFEYVEDSNGPKLHNKSESVDVFGGRLLANSLEVSRLFNEKLFSQLLAPLKDGTALW